MSEPATASVSLPFQEKKLRLPQFSKQTVLTGIAGLTAVGALFLLTLGILSARAVAQHETDQVLFSAIPDSEQQSAHPSQNSSAPTDQIVIDISGAVERPGLQNLPSGSRLGDAVAAAGGITDKADTRFIAREINFAETLHDAQKVYIPFEGEEQSLLTTTQPTQSMTQQTSDTTQISISTASLTELESLDGIGEKRAAAIIAGRPYTSLSELVSRDILSASLYAQIEEHLRL